MTAVRSSTTLWRRALAAAALVLATGLAAGVAQAAGETKEFEAANVRWTLPDDWKWMEPSADDKASGVFAQAASEDSHIHAFGMSGPSNGLSLEERVQELAVSFRAWVSGNLIGSKVLDTVLAGRDAKCVVYVGTDANDNDIQVRAYAVETDGKFYHLVMRVFHNEESSRADELNALRDGFQLIKGGGTQVTVETFTEIPRSGAAGGGGDGPKVSQDDKSTGDEPWPEKGPVRDGNKISLPEFNFEWTLPADGPFSWRNPIPDMSALVEGGVAVQVLAVVDRVKGEFDPEDAPKQNACRGYLLVEVLKIQHDSKKYIRDERFHRWIEQNFGVSEFDSRGSRNVDEVPVGNSKGVMALRLGSNKQGIDRHLVCFQVNLRGILYTWWFVIDGYAPDRLKQFQPLLSKLMAGVRFPENTDYVPGPLIPTDGLATFSGKRGKAKDEEKKYEISGFSWTARSTRSAGGYTATDGWVFKKPPGLAELLVGERGLQLALETRSEDGQCYIYYSVWAEATARLQNEKREPEAIIDDHAKSWLSTLGDTAKASKSGKSPYFRGGSYEGEKGLKYEFTATVDGVPYTEEGYVIDHKQTTYWVRIQLGGKNAEKVLKDELKAIKKGFSWAR
ncbi:MAG: hypothetical protein H6806_06705 [Planctomycetes bacterium]|nr:hypothetical protein [Planctomycetota bacterium]MCB9829432.1 hypothetical protein [Planctomycetota bacterium]MCB9900190.1 hypothetical protein [Planctomycetota bacterium]